MLGIGLTLEDVAKRLVRLRNLELLHTKQKRCIEKLVTENRALKQQVAAFTATVAAQSAVIQDLKLQMDEMRAIVFGKKKQKEEKRDDDFPPSPVVSCEPRSKESYHRKLPAEGEITETRDHSISHCSHCGGSFDEREIKTYFEEDIPLPQKKIVMKHVVEQGHCATCSRWSSAALLPSAPVILGRNVQRYICYLNVVCRQPYSEIEDILKQSYDFAISQGEIAKIMEREANRLRSAFEQLKVRIRGEPSIHLDETGWDILTHGDRSFAWTMTGGVSHEAVFALGKTRGKGNAEKLVGDSEAVVVSDDYAVYRNLENDHQLCCAHILRKLRDLATSSELDEMARLHCRASCETFVAIYADIEAARQSEQPMAGYAGLLERLTVFAIPHNADPKKLLRVKAQVAARPANYLTCLRFPNVAPDNNAAERSLRHLVIKRKISFGSLSEKTAETMAILLSVLMSWKRRGELRNYLAGV